MILIYPPLVKPCEPPPGIARLSGALKFHGVECSIIDANSEGVAYVLGVNSASSQLRNLSYGTERRDNSTDTWTARARAHLGEHIGMLTSWHGYTSMQRYKNAVLHVNRVLEKSYSHTLPGVRVSLDNFISSGYSPLKSGDLLKAAENPECTPFYYYFRDRLIPLFEKKQPLLVGISLNYLSQAICAFSLIGMIKKIFPSLKIVMGGGLVTSWMRRLGWKNPFGGLVDVLVEGSGEEALLSMLNIHYGEFHATPDYSSLFPGWYLSPGPILPYAASSGCYWGRCTFCPERAEGNPYRRINVSRVYSDLEILIDRHNPVLIHFLDNALDPELLEAFTVRPPGKPWYGFVRISPLLANPDFCLALKQAGCVMLQIGLESGDQKVLDDMGKGFDLETASSVLTSVKKAGIATYVYLLFGTPSESIDEARKTQSFIIKHASAIDYVNLSIFNLPVHCPVENTLETYNFYEGDLTLYRNFIHPRGWDRQCVRRYLEKEFKKNSTIGAIVRNTPPFFTSNHAPLFFYTGNESIRM